jgi:hypothetical protein
MNAERLHAIAKAIRDDLRITSAVNLLEQLSKALQNQVNNPQEPSFQKQVADTLSQLIAKLENASSNTFPPTWKQEIEELQAESLLGAALADRIREILNRNQITPTVAVQEITAIQNELKKFENTIKQLLDALSALHIGANELPPGDTELGLLIPRDFVNNRLEDFAEELKEDDRILGVFAEVASGNRPGFPIESISSSEFSIFLDVAPPVAACIAVAVERIVSLYKQLLEIRKLRAELEKYGVPEENAKGIEAHAETVMENGIEELIPQLLTDFYRNAEPGRRNELKIELRQSLRKIANRIDRGFNIEIRMTPTREGDAPVNEDQANYEKIIADAEPSLQFLKREGRPILSLREKDNEQPPKKEVPKKSK